MTPTMPVLAWVVPGVMWQLFDNAGDLVTEFNTDPTNIVSEWDASSPSSAPHSVRQLAEVVAVVTIDDAMVARGASVLRSAKWDLTLHTYEEIVRAALTAALGEAPGTGARPTAQGA